MIKPCMQLTKLFLGSLLLMISQLRLCCSNEPGESVSLVFVCIEDLAADTELDEISWSNMTKEIKFQCNKEDALEVFYDALAAPFPFVPVVIVDGVCSEATEAVAAVSKYYCLPVISYTTPLEFPSTQDIFPHLFSVVPSDHYFAVGTAHFITYYNWQRVVVISQDQEHHKRIKEDLLTLLESNDLTMISDVRLPMKPSRLHDFELFFRMLQSNFCTFWSSTLCGDHLHFACRTMFLDFVDKPKGQFYLDPHSVENAMEAVLCTVWRPGDRAPHFSEVSCWVVKITPF